MAIKIIQLDLFSDWIEIIRLELGRENYQTNNVDDEKLSILYFALQKRLIKAKPRNIFKSDTFTCPAELQNGLDLLEHKIRNGENLKPNLSKKLKILNDQDGLLFDWGIYHLHLGENLETNGSGFIQRTGPLLYARFDNVNAYFINVLEHNAWTTQDLIKTIHRNWPESIESYRIKGVIGVERNLTDNEIKDLRNVQINSALEIAEGIVYAGPGGGIAASGDSIESVMRHSQNQEDLEELEMSMRSDITGFLNSAFKNNLDFLTNTELVFKLKKSNEKYYIHEENNNFRLLFDN